MGWLDDDDMLDDKALLLRSKVCVHHMELKAKM